MDGFNATIFAYGQSGSGKTFSMLGPEQVTELLVNQSSELTPEVEALFGIVPRAIFQIFEIINEGKLKGINYTLKVSYIEIYNESINDILSMPPALNLKLREFPNQGMCVIGMQEVIANNPEAVFEVISAGTANKIVCSTGQNARSSRSHTVFILTCEQFLLDGSSKVSKINLVDLAGSEKLSKTGAQGQALKEAQKINLSLTTLGRCIKALTGKPGEHIPFRESKLTLILKESLGGNSKTTLIVTGSMRKVHQEETISTMQFAERAKMVKTIAKSNVKRSVEELENMVEQMKEEISKLRKQLTLGGGTIIEDSNELQELRAKYMILQNSSEKKIEELTDAIERKPNIDYAEEREILLNMIEETRQGLERLKFEKDTEQKVYEEFIEEIVKKEQENKEIILQGQNEISSGVKVINNLKAEVRVKDELLRQISQEKEELVLEIGEYKEILVETREEMMRAEREKEVILGENKGLIEKMQEISTEKTGNDVIIDKLEYYTQTLLDKIDELEVQNSEQAKKILESAELLEKFRSEALISKEASEIPQEIPLTSQQNTDLLEENTRLQLKLTQAIEEIEVIKSTISSSTDDSYQKLSKMKQDLDKSLQEKSEILSALLDFKKQIDSYELSNQKVNSEHAEQKKTIQTLLGKIENLEKNLEESQRHKIRAEKSLKFFEDKHEKLAEDIETNVKVKLQLSINIFVKQISELQTSLLLKEKEIKELKSNSKEDYQKLKSDLAGNSRTIMELNSQIKILMEEYEIKIDKIFQEKESLKIAVGDKISENMRLKMDLSNKDSLIYNLKLKNEQQNSGNAVKRPIQKMGLFAAKKHQGKIPQEMIKSLYSNSDLIEEEEEKV